MRTLLFLICMMSVIHTVAQSKRVEKKEWTENGVVKGYTITTETDQNGNIISRDSVYTEGDAASGGGGNFQFYFEGPGNSNFHFYNDTTFQNGFYSFGSDSLFFEQFRSRQFNIDQYLKEYRQFLKEQLEIPIDSIPPKNEIILPENSKIKKI